MTKASTSQQHLQEERENDRFKEENRLIVILRSSQWQLLTSKLVNAVLELVSEFHDACFKVLTVS